MEERPCGMRTDAPEHHCDCHRNPGSGCGWYDRKLRRLHELIEDDAPGFKRVLLALFNVLRQALQLQDEPVLLALNLLHGDDQGEGLLSFLRELDVATNGVDFVMELVHQSLDVVQVMDGDVGA